MSTWEECVGETQWLLSSLQNSLHYATPLPVQSTVIPTISRAMQSNIPLDVSLTAPTGSGKTLCYLIPMLRMISMARACLDTTQLRALILVPTKALGQQVYRELVKLTRHYSVSVVSLCAEVESVKDEAHSLVRAVHLPQSSLTAIDNNNNNISSCRESLYESTNYISSNYNSNNNNYNINMNTPEYDGESLVEVVYFAKADILIATPQRLLRHLDNTPGLSLRHLRLLVIDEADQVLAGNFANFVSKVVDRFDAEVDAELRREYDTLRASYKLSSDVNAECVLSAFNLQRRRDEEYVLHKMLCSATLSSRITRISEVRLRNCRYFTLDSNGMELDNDKKHGSNNKNILTTFALPPKLQEHIVFVEDSYRHAVLLKLVRTLIDRITAKLFTKQVEQVKDDNNGGNDKTEWQPEEINRDNKERSTSNNDYPCVNDDAGNRILIFCNSADEARVMGHFLSAAGVRQVIEFTTHAQESERRRALLLSNVESTNTMSTTTTTSLPEENGSRYLPRTTSLTASSVMCVVASDALMRGIDLPHVGHVIMYHPPRTIAQYVHRAGRTARAHHCGHVHFLLTKHGPSGSLEDGEVAHWQRLSQSLLRTLPVKYERHFFMFATPPEDTIGAKKRDSKRKNKLPLPELQPTTRIEEELTNKTTTSNHESKLNVTVNNSNENNNDENNNNNNNGNQPDINNQTQEEEEEEEKEEEKEEKKPVIDERCAEWWVDKANKYLSQSQFKLQGSWTSALQAAMQNVKNTKQNKHKHNSSNTNNKSTSTTTLKQSSVSAQSAASSQTSSAAAATTTTVTKMQHIKQRNTTNHNNNNKRRRE